MNKQAIGGLFTFAGMLLVIWSLNRIGRKKFRGK